MARNLDDKEAKSKIAQVIIWLLFITALLSAIARLGTKYAITSSLHLDDWLMVAAMGLYLAQCVTASMVANNGLGVSIKELGQDKIVDFLKAEYASVPLLIIAFAFVKWSNSAFIRQLTPDTYHLRADLAMSILTALWCLSSIFLFFFQCPVPETWDYRSDKCLDRRALWTYFDAINILTDIGIIVLFFLILSTVQTSFKNKAKLLVIFATRFIAIALAVGHIASVWDSYQSEDITQREWSPAMLNQAVLCISITSACLPYLKPFMQSLESGIVRVENLASEEDLRPRGSEFSTSLNLTDGRSFTKTTVTVSTQ